MPDFPDYKEPYLILMRATEQAIRTLTEAQLRCEELIIRDEDGDDCPPTPPLPFPEKR